MFFVPITQNEVEKVAKGFTNKLPTGVDEIHDYVVKQCIQFLKKPLTNIYNASIESGIFPDQLKISKVIPLQKKGTYRIVRTTDQLRRYQFFKIAREIGVQQSNGIH